MSAKQWTNKDKIYVYSTLKQFCLPVFEFLTIWCHSYAWIRNSGKNILIIPKVRNLGPKKWMNLQYCRIRKSLKISLWIRNLGKILSKSANPFAYSPPSSQIAYIPLVCQITVVLSSNKMLSLSHIKSADIRLMSPVFDYTPNRCLGKKYIIT